jgi:hypothetical protein
VRSWKALSMIRITVVNRNRRTPAKVARRGLDISNSTKIVDPYGCILEPFVLDVTEVDDGGALGNADQKKCEAARQIHHDYRQLEDN